MRRNNFSSLLLIFIIVFGIIGLDITRRYLSGDFDKDKLELEVLYSSEKAGWLESVVDDFEKQWAINNSGKEIKVIMTAIGTGKGTIQVATEASKPAVWSPASRFWLTILNDLWATNNNNPIVDTNAPSLVVSPSIIATWESYLDSKNGSIKGFEDLRQLSLNDNSFTFAHTDPFESNSGFGAVIMEAAVAVGKNPESITLDDLANDDVQQWMRELESAAIQYGSSTGFLGKLMASEGPNKLKAAVIYENLVIEKNKELTEDRLIAVYPEEGTVLNDHPFAILDADWVTDLQKELAQDFLDYLRSPPAQIVAINFGFRPSIEFSQGTQLIDSIFVPEAGVRNNLSGIKIYSIANIDPKVLDRIPDLWSATRSRSLGDSGSEPPTLTFQDYIIPLIIIIFVLLILFNPLIDRVRRYYR